MQNPTSTQTASAPQTRKFQLQTFDKHQGWQTLETFDHLTDADAREHEIQDSFREQGLDVKTRVQPTASAQPQLPPSEFSNIICDVSPGFDYSQWRKSPQWRIFVAGYNAAVTAANASIKAKYNFGQITEKLFENQ